jgi:uncharacterized protein YkwD
MTQLRFGCYRRILLLFALGAPLCAAGGVLDSVNSVRTQGCPLARGAAAPLRENRRLDEVARQIAAGAALDAAQRRAGYRALNLYTISIAPVDAGGEVSAILGRQFCAQVADPKLREIGSFRRGERVWLALAVPFDPPSPRQLPEIGRRVIELTNRARSAPQRCGATEFAPAAALTLDATLTRVALDYARDMARLSFMDHTGRDGSTPPQRISAAGYRWIEAGENLASGITTPEQLVAGWLHSPEHCANLMAPGFREAGVAFALDPGSDAGIYWAMEFGTRP